MMMTDKTGGASFSRANNANLQDMILGTDTGTNTIAIVTKKKPIVPENGLESARIKKMFNDVDSDVHFYQKMSDVYKAAAIAFKENMAAEMKAKEQRQVKDIEAGLVVENIDQGGESVRGSSRDNDSRNPVDRNQDILVIESSMVDLKVQNTASPKRHIQSAATLKRAAKSSQIMRGRGRDITSVKVSPRGSNASTFDPSKLAITP